MKTLQVGNIDTIGGRFNGADLHRQLLKRGIESQFCVWTKETNYKNTWRLTDFPGRGLLNRAINLVERKLSLHSVLYPFSWQLPFDKRFHSADIIHYHLIHTGFFSLSSLPTLSRLKPSVWTLHDPWAMTGHCIHPYKCEKWKTGCGECPRLNTPISMLKDHTALMWNIKKWAYKNADIDIIVASKWMLNMAKQSPLLSNFRLHHIPFGIDLNVFHPMDKEKAKHILGVKPGSIVLAFRATSNEFKGLSFIKHCLHKLKLRQPICLITLHERGLLDEFIDKYQIIDMGWVSADKLPIVYNACDIFLMPSTAEAFGMTAIEAMACGKPVIVFDDTSLPEVIFAPKGGIAVPQGDVEGLMHAIESLIEDSQARQEIGDSAIELVRKNYNLETFMERIMELYREVIKLRE
ncbi:glycosyltransferase [Candidatus Methanoperedens nitroreducens]|uniref:Glycosyltransferase n=1 Tax=Candidatus Methanoperedens nitratireducens TaxID=1392998 RepID=A0A062UZ06_9EURY|nr:glycosyltransferase [Candidatus Methanoperedens nitroreducens]KCZ72166.1 glycosyltransferase [Candidatus Methanoperedens nitroreducens]MDJ1421856.1 glycosyltransferase [Candidatus Methanoperedens sp.]